MARKKKRVARDMASGLIRDLIQPDATAVEVLEAQHCLLEAYRRGQAAATGYAGVSMPQRLDAPQQSPVAPQEAQISQARVDDWLREVLVPKAQAMAPHADESRLTRLMLADRTIGPWLKDRSEGKDSPGDAAIAGAIVQMLKRASLATSQGEEDDGE